MASFKTELKPTSWRERRAIRAERRTAQTTDKGHGRIEVRKIKTTARPCVALRKMGWVGVQQVFQIERTRIIRGITTRETAYGISSLSREEADAATILKRSRGHWEIENGLHHVRDVTMGEDACRVRTGSAPQSLAIIRNASLFLLSQTDCKNYAAALRKFSVVPEKALALIRGEN